MLSGAASGRGEKGRTRMCSVRLLSPLCFVAVVGCAASSPTTTLKKAADTAPYREAKAVQTAPVREDAVALARRAEFGAGGAEKEAEPAGGAGGKPEAAAAPLPRKIIYTADVHLVVADLGEAEE